MPGFSLGTPPAFYLVRWRNLITALTRERPHVADGVEVSVVAQLALPTYRQRGDLQMRRVLRWIWAPVLLAVAVTCLPAKQASAQTSMFFGGPRGSVAFSTGGYYGAPYPVPYGAYYGPRPYYPRPYGYGYGGGCRPHFHHHHHGGYRGGW